MELIKDETVIFVSTGQNKVKITFENSLPVESLLVYKNGEIIDNCNLAEGVNENLNQRILEIDVEGGDIISGKASSSVSVNVKL